MIVGDSIAIHPILAGILIPQPDLIWRPYGAFTNISNIKPPNASTSQAKIN